MPFTHGYDIIGDGHTRGTRGPGASLLDPVYGLVLTCQSETQPAVVNTIITGAFAQARVTKVVAPLTYIVEKVRDNIGAFAAGEALTYDYGAGGTATASVIMSTSAYQGPVGASTENVITGRRDATFNSFIPDDGSNDTVFWDRQAKVCQRVTLATGWSGQFLPGQRVTTSSGGSFTVWNYADAGSGVSPFGAVYLWIIKKTGTVAAGDTLTNLNFPAATGTLSAVDADPPVGMWKRLHMLPNDAGQGIGGASVYERIPWGDGSDGQAGYGPMHTLLRKAVDRWRLDADPANRGVRGFLFEAQDFPSGAGSSLLMGGVTVQSVEITGGAGTYTIGETVNAGTWSAKVHNVNVAGTRLYVTSTNGNVLSVGATITGATSGATRVAATTCIGWHPGSYHWQNMVAEKAAADAAPGALFSGSPKKHEGLFCQIWETELGPMSAFPNEAFWPTQDLIVQEWTKFIEALRTLYGNPTLPITLMQFDARSHADPYALIQRGAVALISRTIPGVAITSTDGMEGSSTAPLPYPSTVLFLRPDDYLELGTRAWRSLQFASTPVPAGRWQPMVIFVTAGQSNMVCSTSSSIMGLDRDPDIWKSATFPGVNSIDPYIWMWNADPNVQQWQNFDIALNGNTFFGQGGFSPVVASLAMRMRARFASEGAPCDIGFIHLPVNGSTANASINNAWTWDPLAPTPIPYTASMTVSVQGTIGSTLDPRRGRFTAGGSFFESFAAGQFVQISGSALGFVGGGGNNHTTYGFGQIHAVAGDGSWIEVVGNHVVETANFTIRLGTIPIMPAAREQIRKAIGACGTQLQRVPQPVGLAYDAGESDLILASGYKPALKRVIDEIVAEVGLARKQATPLAVVIARLTAATPWGTDEEVALVRAAHEQVAAELPNGAIINTDKLQMESAGIWPRTVRQDNNVHRTLQAYIAAGYLFDRAFATLEGIPPHPDGEIAVDDTGAVNGGGFTGGAGTDFGGGTDAAGDPLTVETGAGLPNADSYLSLAEAEERIAMRGNVPAQWTAATDAQKNDWLRESTARGIDLLVEPLLSGYRVTETQALAWPRNGVYDVRSRRVVQSTEVPDSWKWLQVEWAKLLAQGIDPLRTIDPTSDKDSAGFAVQTTDKLAGGLERSRTYSGSGGSRPTMTIPTRIWMMAAPFLEDVDSVGLA